MTRVLSIVVALLALSSVFAAAGVYAAPASTIGVAERATADLCVELANQRVVTVANKICVKRHTLGVPCTPMPVILPAATALGGIEPTMVLAAPPALERADQRRTRLYRPPRITLA